MRVKTTIAVVLLVAAIWLYGAIYVVYGEGLGLATCWKQGWSFRNTFVDYEQVLIEGPDRGWEGREMPVPWKVLNDLKDCELVEDPKAWSRDQTIGLILLTVVLSGGLLLASKYKRPDGED